MAGLALGAAPGVSGTQWLALDSLHALMVALLCGGAGHVLELLTALRTNGTVARAINDEVLTTTAREVEARSELLARAERQQRWVDMMESQVSDHKQAMAEMASRLAGLGEDRVRTLRGFSHDLRNPLTALSAGAGDTTRGGCSARESVGEGSWTAERADACNSGDSGKAQPPPPPSAPRTVKPRISLVADPRRSHRAGGGTQLQPVRRLPWCALSVSRSRLAGASEA